PSDRVKSFRQRFYIYMMLTAPSERLIITYPRTGSDGKGVNKSYLIDTIENMFELKLTHVEERSVEDRMHTKTEAYRLMLQLMAKVRDEGLDCLEEEDRLWLEKLVSYFGEDEKEYNQLLEQVFFTYKPNPFSEEIMLAINECFNEDETVRGSVTKFETFAKCGFRYFMDYVLKTRDRELYELSYMDIGNCYHAAIERYCSLITENNEDWHKLDGKTIEHYSKEAIDYAVETMPKSASNLDAVQKHILEGMKETLSFCMKNLTWQVQEGLFDPTFFEEPVTNELVNPVSGERNAIVHGKIDRIDLHHTDKSVGVRIVDYKSSAREFSASDCFYGLSMQLPMYMSFAVEKLKEKYPNLEVNPSAFLYYHVDDPMVAGNAQMDIDALRIKERTLKGLIVDDELNLQANDTKLEAGRNSEVVKVSLKKDGNPGVHSDVVSNDDMKTILEYAKVNGALLSEDILGGKFEPIPVCIGGKSCHYCPYTSVCRFNPGVPGTMVRVCANLSKDDAIGLMREQLDYIKENGQAKPVVTLAEVKTDEMD
ncbi:MAG: PD-(D/E)XK nuclease family protein, partial [Parasporobacterium sp.]|nr:PD-(D/E)XK nuclease family protein [Parasporobacterium sp.]